MVKESKLPKKLYKYRKFNTSTLRLLSQAEVYYADPETFNDPLDCRPVIRVDTDVPTLEKVCYRMLVLAHGKERALASMNNSRYMSTEHGDFRKDQAAIYYYTQDLRQDIKRLLYEEMRKHGVLSLAGRWDCPLMWSHYADEHRGLCIEYDVTDHKCEHLSRVDYGTSGEVKVSDLFEWKLRGSADRRANRSKRIFLCQSEAVALRARVAERVQLVRERRCTSDFECHLFRLTLRLCCRDERCQVVQPLLRCCQVLRRLPEG